MKYSKIPILRPPLGLSKSGLLLDSPKGGLLSEVHCVENEEKNN